MKLNEAKAKVKNENPKSVLEEDIYLCDVSIFSDLKEHYYDIDCYDGFAIGRWTHDEQDGATNVPKEIIFMYPELADVLADEDLAQSVLDYRGLWDLKPSDITYGDVMMALGNITDYTW